MIRENLLLILTPGFPSGEQDSTCLPAQQEFVRSLRRKAGDMKIIIIAFQYPFEKGLYCWNGIPVMAFNGGNRRRLHRLQLWWRVWKKMKCLHQRHEKMSILSFWYGECCFLGSRFARKYSLDHFCWILGQDARKGNAYVKTTRAPARELVAMSEFLADEFQRNYSFRPEHVITNGISIKINEQTRSRDIDVLGAGSLIPLKQYGIFIDCIREAKKYFPAIRCVICGKGPEKQGLRQRIAAEGLEENLHLADEVDHEEVLDYMRRSKLFLHPSSYEGFSTVCLEALSAGAHVLSFCRPMKQEIPQWHIVSSALQMKEELLRILSDCFLEHKTIVPYEMDEVAGKWMKLLAPQPVAKAQELV